MGAQNVGQKQVYVAAGTGTRGVKQVNVTGTTGAGVFQTWTQITAAQFAQGPTGQFETVQRVNAGTVLTQSTKTVCIPSFIDPNAGGGGAYTAKAVHFDGSTYLSTGSLTAPATTQSISMSFWFKGNDGASWMAGGVPAVVDPDGAYDTYVDFSSAAILVFLGDNNGQSFTQSTGEMAGLDNNWHHCLFSGQSIASPVDRMFIDGVDLGDITTIFQAGSFTMPFGGKKFVVGSDGLGTSVTGDMADIWIAPGTYLVDGSNTIPPATVVKFISGGKPQNPTGFPATGAVLFSGDASTFATNQGSGGSFTVTGALTTAGTHP